MISKYEIIDYATSQTSPIHFGAVNDITGEVYDKIEASLGSCSTCEYHTREYNLCEKLAIQITSDFFCKSFVEKS